MPDRERERSLLQQRDGGGDDRDDNDDVMMLQKRIELPIHIDK